MKRKMLHVYKCRRSWTLIQQVWWGGICDDIQYSNYLVLNKDTDDSSSEEENIGTDSTGTIHTELKIVEEEDEYDFSTDTDDEENENEPDEYNDENDGTDKDIDSIHKVFAFLQEDIMCFLQDKQGISGSWILLDSHPKM